MPGSSRQEPETRDAQPVLAFASAKELDEWYAGEHARTPGLWLKIARKASGIPTVTHHEALDSALCYGWIDGQRVRYDDVYFLQRFVPRRPRSNWSQVNRDNVERLIAEGRMQSAGFAAIEAAKNDGRWERASAPPSKATVPDDLQVALDANGAAAAAFAALNRTNRFAILFHIEQAKRPETRARRIQQYVDQLASGEPARPLNARG